MKIKQILAVVVFLCFLAYPVLSFKSNHLANAIRFNSQNTQVLSLWHIESFEGGSGNRGKFIERCTRQFEKENKGVYILVQTKSEEEAINSLENGATPNLISFSHHIGEKIKDKLCELTSNYKNVRDDLLSYGVHNKSQFAVPYLLGAYCLIGNAEINANVKNLKAETCFSYSTQGKKIFTPSLSVGLSGNSFQFKALLSNVDKVNANFEVIIKNFDKITTFEAYNEFCKGNASILLGTTRDYYRIYNKQSMGVMRDCVYIPLGHWTDLVQFMGAMQNGGYEEKFIEFITNSEMQQNITNIGMFSTSHASIWQDEHYKNFEKILLRPLQSLNVFMSSEDKLALWNKTQNQIFGVD